LELESNNVTPLKSNFTRDSKLLLLVKKLSLLILVWFLRLSSLISGKLSEPIVSQVNWLKFPN
jgi:hypothetical protein